MFYVTYNDVGNRNKIVSATERVLKLFPKYFSIIGHLLENIDEAKQFQSLAACCRLTR